MNRDEINRIILDNELFHGTMALGVVMDADHLEKFAHLVAAAERQSVLVTIDELRGMESDRNTMFSDGYDHALSHIEEFIRAREKG